MTEQEKKKMQDKMTPELAAKAEYLMQIVRLHSVVLANTLNELAYTMEACGCDSDSTTMRNFAKSIMDVSQSFLIGGNK